MSCGYGTRGFKCDQIYTLGGTVSQARADEIHALGVKLGLTEFNPTSVNWDAPISWKGVLLGGAFSSNSSLISGLNSAAATVNAALGVENTSGAIMGQGTGYGLLFGFGFALTFITIFLSWVEIKFGGAQQNSEFFNTAGRDIKTGLTAADIVSQWTWAATLLQSSNVAWQYGISGPFWYAAGATIQILLFGIIAIEVKRRAPGAHTFLEIIKLRWGTCAHFVFFWYGIAANAIVSAMLLLGGCAVFKGVTGIPIEASSFIVPIMTMIYTLMGGLKATFIAGYVHTVIIMIVLIYFVSLVYAYEHDCSDTTKACTTIGSASVMYERLQFMTALPKRFGSATVKDAITGLNKTYDGFHQGPANLSGEQNREGSYLTMMSSDGVAFGIINIIGNFGTVFVDQSYWQTAIAAKPGAAHKGYILGGMVWFAIPFALGTSLGLAGTALNVDITADEAGQGLVPPAAAIAMLGEAGALLIMVQLTMAILSTGSAEQVAVASLIAYDVYREYINPKATGTQIMWISRIGVVVWAFISAILSIILQRTGLGLGWVYNWMAIILGSAVPPIAMSLYDKNLDTVFAIAAALLGTASAITVWLITASTYGPLNVENTGQLYAQLGGGLAALLVSQFICWIGVCVRPQNYDWDKLINGIKLVAGDGGENSKVIADDDPDGTPEALLRAQKWIFEVGWFWSIFLIILWPLAMVPLGAFGKSSFQAWAALSLVWGWMGGVVIIFLPIYESLDGIFSIFSCGKKKDTNAKLDASTA